MTLKRKGKGKKLFISLVALVLVGAIGAGAYLYFGQSNAEPVNVYPFMYLGMTEYWGDSQESYGFVETDKIQTVYVSSTQTITEIMVSLGDTVKKGDILMTFDTTLSDLALERERLNVEKLKLQLQDAKDRLKEINSMKPMVIPPPPAEDENPDENLGELLTDPYRISHNSDFDGSSSESALICWLNTATPVEDLILQELLLKAEEYQAINREKEEAETPPEEIPGDSEAEPAEEAPAETDPAESEPVETEPAETDPTEPDPPTEPEEPERIKGFYVVFKVTDGNRALAAKLTWQGIYVIPNDSGSEYSFKFFDASLVQDHMLAPDEEAEEAPEIDYGSGFTAAQIAQMRSEQEKLIKELEFNIKMAEANYKIKLTEASDGNVYAQVDGTVVSLLTEEEARMLQQPVIKVSGGGGFYIEGTISELDKATMQIGQEVTINDWNTGMVYVGTIHSIGDYPSAEGYWSGIGNPNASYYPFRVFVDESADLQAGGYVSIQFSAGSSEHGIYLENPFIRTENGRSYVYVQGDDGLLEQRFVVTGKSLWGSYTEILAGITEEDLIAFPYGKHVKPGAVAVESDISALYE